MAMKEEIISYFKNDRSYQGGISLYMKYGNRIGFKKQLNVQVESVQMLNTLHEELRSVAGMDHQQLRSLLSDPVGKPPLEEAMDPRPRPATRKPAAKGEKIAKEAKKPASKPKESKTKQVKNQNAPQQKTTEKKEE